MLSGAVGLWLVVGGCDRQSLGPTSSRAADARAAAPAPAATTLSRSPLAVVQALHERRVAGQYSGMSGLLVPECREAVVELVLSVDRLMAAEARLQAAIRARIGEGSAERFSQRVQVANILGPLSRDMRLVDQTVDGDRAVVTFQIADRVPLETVTLVRRDGAWLVASDRPIAGLAAEVQNLARSTSRVADELTRNQWSAEQVGQQLDLRQRPIVRRIRELTAATEREGGEGG